MIRRFKTTTASVHDSQIDLSELNEVVYRDRGYFGAIAKGFAATMQRAVRGHPLEISDLLRNERSVVRELQENEYILWSKKYLMQEKFLLQLWKE